MPGFDGTGPLGLGPMTGRCGGYCVLERRADDSAASVRGFAGAAGRPLLGAFPYGARMWRLPYAGPRPRFPEPWWVGRRRAGRARAPMRVVPLATRIRPF